MRTSAKVGVVLTGYATAVAGSIAASWLYNVHVSRLPYDTSGGMYAGGEMLSGLATFSFIALFPTLLALWFLRRHGGFWNAVSVVSVLFAAIGLVAVLASANMAVTRSIPLTLLSVFGLAQLLGVPLWALAFGFFTLLAPTPRARQLMIVALSLELVIGVCAFLHWFVPGSRL